MKKVIVINGGSYQMADLIDDSKKPSKKNLTNYQECTPEVLATVPSASLELAILMGMRYLFKNDDGAWEAKRK